MLLFEDPGAGATNTAVTPAGNTHGVLLAGLAPDWQPQSSIKIAATKKRFARFITASSFGENAAIRFDGIIPKILAAHELATLRA